MKKRVVWLKYGIFFLLVLMSASCSTQDAAVATTDSGEAWTPQVTPTSATETAAAYESAAYIRPPQTLTFCGEPVPLKNEGVRERFDREFTIVVYNNARVYLWLKRMHRDFPWIEKLLHRLALPDDLKYFIVQETNLLPQNWLINTNNGRLAGLNFQVTGNTQQDFQQGVQALLLTLKGLRSKFPSWPLALAAYNAGQARVEKCMRVQDTSNYYHLQISPENDTYVPRIEAIKAVLSDPGRYGYHLPPGAGY